MKEIGLRIKKVRKEIGISQSVMAENLGVKRSTYSGYENGVHCMSYETLINFSILTESSIDYILKGEGSRNETQKELLDRVNRMSKLILRIKVLINE